jgi:hypothetical protein
MAEVVAMPEPTERTPTLVMRKLAISLVNARELADELLFMNPHVNEPADSLLSQKSWPMLVEDLIGWRYMLDLTLAVLDGHADAAQPTIQSREYAASN